MLLWLKKRKSRLGVVSTVISSACAPGFMPLVLGGYRAGSNLTSDEDRNLFETRIKSCNLI